MQRLPWRLGLVAAFAFVTFAEIQFAATALFGVAPEGLSQPEYVESALRATILASAVETGIFLIALGVATFLLLGRRRALASLRAEARTSSRTLRWAAALFGFFVVGPALVLAQGQVFFRLIDPHLPH